MSSRLWDVQNREGVTKKLLRFGTDQPQCANCQLSDERCLCRVKSGGLILCGNCKAKCKPFSPKAAVQKARRFEEAGYSKPACVVCHDPRLQILELDHLAGEANSAFVEPLCANHHAIKSFMAESGPMAALRLRDPNRSALVLQAAFEMGLGAILGMFAVWDGMREERVRSVFLGVAAMLLMAWALWNLAADAHFKKVLGLGYDRAIPAEVPLIDSVQAAQTLSNGSADSYLASLLQYCQQCGSQLPHEAAYCPSCGQAVWKPQSGLLAYDVSLVRSAWKRTYMWLGLCLLGLIVAGSLIGYAWNVHSREAKAAADAKAAAETKAAAEANAARSAQALSQRIDQLVAARISISNLISKINVAGSTLTSDFAQASSASQQRHDDLNIFLEYDEAQNEQSYVKKARAAEADMESLETQYCAQWQALYGLGATRQLCSDVASTSEARENQVTEWLRAIEEIIENLGAAKQLQVYPYSNSEVVTHYTNAEAAASSAEKFRKLEYDDADNLMVRLTSDISKANARRSAILAQYPHLPHQDDNPFLR